MEDDYSDILGSGTLNVKPQSSLPFGVKIGFWVFTLFILYVLGASAWNRFLKWRERSYRLAMRRRHGIPDSDHRPFNVAYAAVQHAREQREALRRAKSRPISNTAREQSRSAAQPIQDTRQRTNTTRNVETAWMRDRAEAFPGAYHHTTSMNASVGPSRHQYSGNGQPAVSLNDEKVLYPRATELVSSASHLSTGSVRFTKRPLDGDTRKRNYAYADISQASNAPNNLRVSNSDALERTAPKRGAKREYGDAEETEEVLESKRAREKRARKVSVEKAIPIQDMEVDEDELEDDEITDHLSRGKKRDRDEAGSTFGGDDEDQSELDEAEDDAAARRRSRKRRSVAKRKSDLAITTRGKKRDRDIDEEPSDDGSDEGYNQTTSRKRRNKKEGRLTESLDEDVSMEEPRAKTKSRKIGEEWTSNGVLYKVGPNGQRLRQALVKRARQKYNMPEDSQHPDRDANLEVYVETWLTEEEYQDAKASYSLAWQDSPKASEERDTHEKALPPPSPTVGKSLLWKSAATLPAITPDGRPPSADVPKMKGRISYDPRRQSTAVDVATRVNPFQQYPAQASKRISSGSLRVSTAGGPGLVDSTNNSPRALYRTYSKWEKQDLEAQAMMKLREAARKKEEEEKERQEKERQEKDRQEKERAEREKSEREKAAMPVPIITVTKAAEDKPPESRVPNFFATPAERAKDTTGLPAAAPSPFTLPSFPKPEAKATIPTEHKAPSLPTQIPVPPTFMIPKAGPTSSPFAPVPKPAEDNTKLTEQPKPSPFAPSAGTTLVSGCAPQVPQFSFSKPAPASEQKKPEQNEQGVGPTLLSRLGVAPGSATAATPSQPSTFSFKPVDGTKSLFNQQSTSAPVPADQPSTNAPAVAPPSSGALKFDFKFQNKSSPAATPSTTATSEPSKPSNAFSFNTPSTTIGTTAMSSAASDSGTTSQKFSFGFTNPTNSASANQEGKSPFGSTTAGPLSGAGSSPFPSFNMGVSSEKSGQPTFTAFPNTGASTDSGAKPSLFSGSHGTNVSTVAAATSSGDSKPAGFSVFGNTQTPGTSDASSKSSPSPFGNFGSDLNKGTSVSGANGAADNIPPGQKPIESTNPAFMFGQRPTEPAATPVSTTGPPLGTPDAFKPSIAFPSNDASKGLNAAAAPSTSTTPFTFGLNNSLSKAGASEGAASAISAASGPFTSLTPSEPKQSLFKFGATENGPSAFSSTLNQVTRTPLFGGQSNQAPAPNATSSTLSSPSGFSAFGSGPNQATFAFGAPSAQATSSSAPTQTSSIFGVPSAPSAFGNTSFPKPSPFNTTTNAQSAFGSTSASTANPTPSSTFQFGQPSMNTTNNTGGQN